MKNFILTLSLIGISSVVSAIEVKTVETAPKFESDLGETVWELSGNANPGTTTRHSVAIARFAVGGQSSKHFHKETEESYYVTQGLGILTVDDEKIELKKGDLVAIKPGQMHHIQNASESEDLVLVVTAAAPWRFDDVFFER